MRDFERQLHDFRLTTIDVTYHLPDHPELLQSFLWQCLDLPPRFPTVERFLDHWRRVVEGRLHSVRIAYSLPLIDGRWRHVEEVRTLH
jgi:uncharacterized protein Usg